MSVDLITALANDLTARLNTLSDLSSESVYVYDTNDVLFERKKLNSFRVCSLLWQTRQAFFSIFAKGCAPGASACFGLTPWHDSH